jgi:PKHD-type hydroxylase
MMNVNKISGFFSKYGVMRSVFSPEEVEKILFLEKILDFKKASVGSGEINEHRDSNVAFMTPDNNTSWIFDKLASVIPKVNYDLFNLDITRLPSLQYTKYDSLMEQHYDWHVDEFSVYNDFQRKISGVIILTGPDEYEGGELEVIMNGNPGASVMLKPAPGEIVFFASHMPHKVHPVTKGVRKSLVFWVEGPWG